MANAAAPSSSSVSTSPRRLPPFFPLVPPACREQSRPFFECFSDASAFDGAAEHADVGARALAACGDARLDAYEACAARHLTERQKGTWAAPQSYLEQAKAAVVAAAPTASAVASAGAAASK